MMSKMACEHTEQHVSELSRCLKMCDALCDFKDLGKCLYVKLVLYTKHLGKNHARIFSQYIFIV